jgi:hypothetical protein
VVVDAGLEVCEDEPRPKELRSHLKTTAGRRAIDRLRERSMAERHAPRVTGDFGRSLGPAARPDVDLVLRCLFEPEQEDIRAAVRTLDPADHLAKARDVQPATARRALKEAWTRAVSRLLECDGARLR